MRELIETKNPKKLEKAAEQKQYLKDNDAIADDHAHLHVLKHIEGWFPAWGIPLLDCAFLTDKELKKVNSQLFSRLVDLIHVSKHLNLGPDENRIKMRNRAFVTFELFVLINTNNDKNKTIDKAKDFLDAHNIDSNEIYRKSNFEGFIEEGYESEKLVISYSDEIDKKITSIIDKSPSSHPVAKLQSYINTIVNETQNLYFNDQELIVAIDTCKELMEEWRAYTKMSAIERVMRYFK